MNYVNEILNISEISHVNEKQLHVCVCVHVYLCHA